MSIGRALALFAVLSAANAGLAPLADRCRNSLANSHSSSALSKPWDSPPLETQADNFIFYRLYTLLQHWPNTRYPSGQSTVPGTIPVGTTLYHGRPNAEPPANPDWLAFDSQHSVGFARGSQGHLFTLVTTRALSVLYFDGSSAAKLSSGSSDTQQLLLWGAVNRTTIPLELKMIVELCEWGRESGIDGYVRMEPNFELMHCNFSENVEIISSTHILPAEYAPGESGRPPVTPPNSAAATRELSYLSHAAEQFLLTDPPLPPPTRPPPPGEPRPPNWKGALPYRSGIIFEAFQAGTLHGRAPGEVRVKLDAARLVTLYDPSLLSGTTLRQGKQKVLHRGDGMSQEDIATWRCWVTDAVREDRPAVSGVDWSAMATTIVDRYGTRLQHLLSILHPDQVARNATAVVERVRSQLLLGLLIDIRADDVPDTTITSSATSLQRCQRTKRDNAWVKPIYTRCSSFALSRLPEQKFTREERILYAAVSGTQTEICRVLSLMWADAYAPSPCVSAEELAIAWRERVQELMRWLDWPMWNWCNPECSPDAICFIPTWPLGIGERSGHEELDKIDWTPKCLRAEDLSAAR